ncbi:hypothetical protein [Undibacterium sp. SXout20W]|uniref:hypothetical protein n=1 Tax=Undibacterium sp. SXout20W TaxID=3413051 RepID=UPI003BF39F8D
MDEQEEPRFSAKQSFNNSIENVAGRDVVNQTVINKGRHLTNDERITLNAKIQSQQVNFSVSAGNTWKFLHRTLGVNSVKFMHIEHLDPANAIVDLMIENSKLKAEINSRSSTSNQSQDSIRTIYVKKQNIWHISALILFTISTAVLAFKVLAITKIADNANSRLKVCAFDGNNYSIGSSITDKNKTEKVCTSSDNGNSPIWKPVPSPQKKEFLRAKTTAVTLIKRPK